MFSNWMKQSECASACSAAAAFSCANLFVMDAVLLASILFSLISLIVLGLHILGVLVALISVVRIMVCKSNQPESLA